MFFLFTATRGLRLSLEVLAVLLSRRINVMVRVACTHLVASGLARGWRQNVIPSTGVNPVQRNDQTRNQDARGEGLC